MIRFGKILNHRKCKSRASAVEVKEGKRGQTSVAGGLRPGPPSLESTPTFSHDSVGAFGWLFLEKSSGEEAIYPSLRVRTRASRRNSLGVYLTRGAELDRSIVHFFFRATCSESLISETHESSSDILVSRLWL